MLIQIKLRHEKATKLEKISHLFWQNSCFYSVASKQVGYFFKFLWPSQKSWTLHTNTFDYIFVNISPWKCIFQLGILDCRKVLRHNFLFLLKCSKIAKLLSRWKKWSKVKVFSVKVVGEALVVSSSVKGLCTWSRKVNKLRKKSTQ